MSTQPNASAQASNGFDAQLHIRVPDFFVAATERAARNSAMTTSEFVRAAIRESLKRNGVLLEGGQGHAGQ